VFDRRALFIGPLNLDLRSIQLNTEIGLVCESSAMAEKVAATLEGALDKIAWRLELIVDASGGPRITSSEGVRRCLEEPEVSASRKFSVRFLGLLPIESQLRRASGCALQSAESAPMVLILVKASRRSPRVCA
jgi:putative cardiolipin synthase